MRRSVLFGQAYYLRFDPKLWAAQQPYAPLGALYAAACARDRGYDVAFFDAMLAASEADWALAIARYKPGVAVIYEDSFNYLSKMCLLRMRQAALAMIASARAQGVPILVAGSDATDHPSTYLEAGALAVVVGEGEITVAEALDAISDGRSLAGIPGLCVRDRDGLLARTPPRGFVADLDTLPRPAWDLLDVEAYRSIWRRRHGYFSMNLATTRGCPYHCNWCAKPVYGQRYAARSPEHVVDEMVWLKHTYRPDHLWIADDIFGLKPGWIERFAEIVTQRGAMIPFKCLLRADGVSKETAKALRVAGARTAWIGAESGSQRVLDAMEKGTQVAQIATATHLLRAEGIEVGFFLQFGYPGETLDDIGRTLQMVRTCRPDDIGISVSYPLPGTVFHKRVSAQLGEKQNWVDSDDLAMMYRATYVPEFYRALHRLVHAEFRVQRAARTVLGGARRAHAAGGGVARRARGLAGDLYRALQIPMLRRRVTTLARTTTEPPAPQLIPLLSRQAAAAPSEHPQ